MGLGASPTFFFACEVVQTTRDNLAAAGQCVAMLLFMIFEILKTVVAVKQSVIADFKSTLRQFIFAQHSSVLV